MVNKKNLHKELAQLEAEGHIPYKIQEENQQKRWQWKTLHVRSALFCTYRSIRNGSLQ